MLGRLFSMKYLCQMAFGTSVAPNTRQERLRHHSQVPDLFT